MFFKRISEKHKASILSLDKQIQGWRKANRKMRWGIHNDEFERIPPLPRLTTADQKEGFSGVILCYGFGDDGSGNSDSVLSGKLAWAYACRRRKPKTWQCQYIDFDKTDNIRLRPGAPPRPRGFYHAKIQTGKKFMSLTISRLRKKFNEETGCGPEGIQFLAITHPHFPLLMNAGKFPFMAFADYDVAPYGFNDFFDAVQMFCSINTLGLGIENVDRNYPLFGIPTIRFSGDD